MPELRELQDFGRDLRTGTRALRRAPAFSAAVVLTIGLGTGAATAVFSVVDQVLLRPLPYPQSDRIVRLFQLNENGSRSNVSELNFDDWQAGTHGFETMALMALWGRSSEAASPIWPSRPWSHAGSSR